MDVASGEDTGLCVSSITGFLSPRKARKACTVVQGEAFYDTLTVPMPSTMPRTRANPKRKSTPSPNLNCASPSRLPA